MSSCLNVINYNDDDDDDTRSLVLLWRFFLAQSHQILKTGTELTELTKPMLMILLHAMLALSSSSVFSENIS